MSRLITIIFGVISCIATAFINFYIQDFTSINIFTFSVFFIVPVGAFLMGALANSGYYLSSLLTNRMLDKYDFYAMVIIAAATIMLVYGIEYYHYVVKANLSDQFSYWQYIAYTVKNSILRVQFTKIPIFTKVGSMGALGYLSLVKNFIGFIAGGAAAFLWLYGTDKCIKCSQYLRNKGKMILYFDDFESLTKFQEELSNYEFSPETYRKKIFNDQNSQLNEISKTIRFIWTLKKCNSCHDELLTGKAEIMQGKDWTEIKDSKTKIIMPNDFNLEQKWPYHKHS